jgi:hypothetical protein
MTDHDPALRRIVDAVENAPVLSLASPKPDEPKEPKRRRTRSLGYDVNRMNEEFAVVLMGSKALVLQEQSGGPIEDQVRFLTLDAFRAWFLNRSTETAGKDGAVKSVTYAEAWLKSPQRRQFKGIEFHPDPDNAAGTPSYFNLWRGFAVKPEPREKAYKTFRDHLLNNVCQGDKELYRWVFGWFAHIVQRPRERVGTALVCRGKSRLSHGTHVVELADDQVHDRPQRTDIPPASAGVGCDIL